MRAGCFIKCDELARKCDGNEKTSRSWEVLRLGRRQLIILEGQEG